MLKRGSIVVLCKESVTSDAYRKHYKERIDGALMVEAVSSPGGSISISDIGYIGTSAIALFREVCDPPGEEEWTDWIMQEEAFIL